MIFFSSACENSFKSYISPSSSASIFIIFSYWSPPVISFTLIKVSSGNVPLFADIATSVATSEDINVGVYMLSVSAFITK